MLAAAYRDCSFDALAALSIGERDRRLLILRQSMFGSRLASVAHCSRCDETLEWTVETTDFVTDEQGEPAADLSVDVDNYHVRFRLPNTLDLAAIAGGNWTDVASARQSLLENCIVSVEHHSEEISASALPVSVTTAIVKRMAEVDPQADLQVELSCPRCGEEWQAQFDIESFFWNEMCSWAQRILSEVHRLARAYGWSETEILNLSPWRRQFYLGLAGT
jgi:uncharacterized metal-binding protein YceD (DUF177 family)